MPLYDYRCPRCGARDEAMAPYDQREHGPACSECGEQMTYVVSAGHTQIYRHANKARRDAKAANISEL